MKLLGIAGNMGTGKDTIAERLRLTRGYEVVAWADAIKQLVAKLFEVDEDTLFGPSELRCKPLPTSAAYWARVQSNLDYHLLSYIRRLFKPQNHTFAWTSFRALVDGWASRSCAAQDGQGNAVTIREVLQKLGTEWGRSIEDDVWINALIRVVADLSRGRGAYTRYGGYMAFTSVHPETRDGPPGIVVPDTRFPNECAALQLRQGRVLWVDAGPRVVSMAGTHASEPHSHEMAECVNGVIDNTGPLETLDDRITAALKQLGW